METALKGFRCPKKANHQLPVTKAKSFGKRLTAYLLFFGILSLIAQDAAHHLHWQGQFTPDYQIPGFVNFLLELYLNYVRDEKLAYILYGEVIALCMYLALRYFQKYSLTRWTARFLFALTWAAFPTFLALGFLFLNHSIVSSYVSWVVTSDDHEWLTFVAFLIAILSGFLSTSKWITNPKSKDTGA